MKKVFQFISFIFFTPHMFGQTYFQLSGGTTTITIVTNDTVWIAADSKVVNVSQNKIDSFRLENKIHQLDGFFYTFTGFPIITEFPANKTLFNSYKLIESAFRNSTSLDSAIAIFQTESQKTLDNLFKLNKKEALSIYNDNPSHIFLELVLVGFVNNKRNVITLVYSIAKSEYFFTRIKTTSHTDPVFLHITGYRSEIEKHINSKEEFRIRFSRIKEQLTELINLQAKVDSNKVGGTIDVVEIYNGGFKWLTKNTY